MYTSHFDDVFDIYGSLVKCFTAHKVLFYTSFCLTVFCCARAFGNNTITFQNNVPSCTDGLFTSWMMLVKMMSPIRQNASIKTGARAATSDPSHNVCMLSNLYVGQPNLYFTRVLSAIFIHPYRLIHTFWYRPKPQIYVCIHTNLWAKRISHVGWYTHFDDVFDISSI